jgi:hypothetical protein
VLARDIPAVCYAILMNCECLCWGEQDHIQAQPHSSFFFAFPKLEEKYLMQLIEVQHTFFYCLLIITLNNLEAEQCD